MAEDKRQALLRGAVQAVARNGMKDVSTRSISGAAGINDAYIYRYFGDKEDLMFQAFRQENERFASHVIRHLAEIQLQMDVLPFRDRFEYVFHSAWRYLLDTPDVCRFFMYYYHSPSFETYAREDFHHQMDALAEMLLHLFGTMENARHCLYKLYILLLSFAVLVMNGQNPDNEETEARAFRTVYSAICIQIEPGVA